MRTLVSTVAALLLLVGIASAEQVVPLESLDLMFMHQGRGKPYMASQGVAIAGQRYAPAVRTLARSVLWLDLGGQCVRFQAMVGVPDDARNRPVAVRFRVLDDRRTLWHSGLMKSGEPAKAVDIDVTGRKRLCLLVDDAETTELGTAAWAQARFVVRDASPQPLGAPPEEIVLLTPKPGPAPRINGPAVYGCRPGKAFLYRIPATGRRPIQFTVTGLPAGLVLDRQTGIITGTAPGRGDHSVRIEASNAHGRAEKNLRIVSGDLLALTPPMGWNHWYAYYNRVTDAMIRQAADAMVASGMADVGYQFVSIDDCWMRAANSGHRNNDPQRFGPLRDAQGNILPNKYFPDMKALADYVHARGLKAGIYTSPGPLTCGGFAGSYQHEAQDARQFADWGYDLLKYDWCSYSQVVGKDQSLAAMQKPYRLMGDLLRRQNRDIQLNLCQYGMGNVWEWGAEVGGHSWRTAGDLGYFLNRIFEVALKNAEHRAWSKPGAWNDPDYIQIGYVGAADAEGLPRPSPLTPTEQYAFMSLWALMASPLFYSGDMSRLDDLTLSVLCNPEVIEVNQDLLGRSAEVKHLTDDIFLMLKPLSDGSLAVGLCNRGELPCRITARWAGLGLAGPQTVRDLWRQQDLGIVDGEFSASVGRRGVALVRIRPAR
jgi:alpha-galactosidase